MGAITMTCCSTTEETTQAQDDKPADERGYPLVYSFPAVNDASPIAYLSRSLSDTTMEN